MDKDTATEVYIPLDSVITFTITAEKDFQARSLVIVPARRPVIARVELQVLVDGSFRTIRECMIDRSNPALNVGFDPYGRVAVALPVTSAKTFRVVISHLKSNYARSWGPAPGVAGITGAANFSSTQSRKLYREKRWPK